MERELWRVVAAAIKGLPRRSPRGGVYDNRDVLAVLLWAALHNQSINWASKRRGWPVQAWRRRLPHQSTLSRRLREPRLLLDLALVLQSIQSNWSNDAGGYALVDGKPLHVSEFSGDTDAKSGWGAGRYAKGYKLHALVDSLNRLLAWRVEPMNVAECTVAAELLHEARALGTLKPGVTLIGDASYDSNPLHAAAEQTGVRLIAPRRRPDRPLADNRTHHPGRLASVAITEHQPELAAELARQRTAVERYFGSMASFANGLYHLPPWVRRPHRVRTWVAAKLTINAARISLRRSVAA
jgi:hypothetical protein